MHTAFQSRLSFPAKDSYTELFGAASPVYEDEYDGEDEIVLIEREILKGIRSPADTAVCDGQLKSLDGKDFCRDDWEWLQEFGDISTALNEKGKLYECIDINEICGNTGVCISVSEEEVDGPTLAELNDGAMSPVVNPDMERLHFVALKTDVGVISHDELTQIRPRGNLRSQWLDKPLRASSWLNSNVALQSADSDVPRFQNQFTAGPLSYSKVVKDTSVDENQNNTVGNRHDNNVAFTRTTDLAREAIDNVCNREHEENNGEATAKQYRDACSPIRSEESECASDDNDDNKSNTHDNSDSDMEEDNFDSDNEDEDGMDANDSEEHLHAHGAKKGRRKEVEDGLPNPRRLLDIGRQLEKLNTTISELKPVHLLPVSARNQTRREKNKLASRACRLKKKATHEANKIKLKGLALEKERLLFSIHDVKRFLLMASLHSSKDGDRAMKYDKYFDMEKQLTGFQVAGNLHKFVESVLKSATHSGNSFNCSTVL